MTDLLPVVDLLLAELTSKLGSDGWRVSAVYPSNERGDAKIVLVHDLVPGEQHFIGEPSRLRDQIRRSKVLGREVHLVRHTPLDPSNVALCVKLLAIGAWPQAEPGVEAIRSVALALGAVDQWSEDEVSWFLKMLDAVNDQG